MAKDFGLTVSISKTKMMVTGREVTAADRTPLEINGTEIESVTEFQYFGSLIAGSRRVDTEVDKRIAQASRAFGALRKAVFMDSTLHLQTKQSIYQARVLSILLYGSECWTPLQRELRKLDSFHHRCIRTVLGITNSQQWEKHITAQEVRQRWGDLESATDQVCKRRLEWLGHLARMPECRIPKMTLFGWLPQPRPQGGPRKRWKDTIHKDLKHMGIPEDKWYSKASTLRTGWQAIYQKAVAEV